MPKQRYEKRERIIEAVRLGLEGDDAVEFIRQSGYPMSTQGIARHLRIMGGRGRVLQLIEEGKTNLEILRECSPEEEDIDLAIPPTQTELFKEDTGISPTAAAWAHAAMYETRRISLRVPEDLYEAIRMAAKAEHKTQNDLIVDILTSALSRMPHSLDKDNEE